MKYKSKYFNLEIPPRKWSRVEFSFAVEILESLKRITLFDLLNKFNIKFNLPSGDEKFLEDEKIISVLISDTDKNNLLNELDKLRHQPPLKFKSPKKHRGFFVYTNPWYNII